MVIPVSKPDIRTLEKKYVNEAIESGWVSSQGPFIPKFENAFSKWNNYKYGVATSSGTTALTVALAALGVGPGDEVIVPDFTMIATAWAVTYLGATPVFIDCDDDLNINVSLIEEAITDKTKVILPVHIYGRQCDMGAIMKIAYEYNLFVVEDSAEAHGIKPVGDIACYSLFANKIITSGEGGICVTNNQRLADQMRHLRGMAFDLQHTFLHKKLGYNFRMTNLQAAVALAQTERIEAILKKRKQIEKWYDKRLPDYMKMPKRNVLWMYDIKSEHRDALAQHLSDYGIETRVFFKPMSVQPMYKDSKVFITDYFQALMSKADIYSDMGLYLPTFTSMSEKEVDYVCSKVRDFVV